MRSGPRGRLGPSAKRACRRRARLASRAAGCKRRLQMLVLKRNRMLKYLRREQRPRYEAVIAGLAIRPNKNFDPTIKPKRATRAYKRSRGKAKNTAKPYGMEKHPKSLTKLRKQGFAQRRLQKARDAARKAEERSGSQAAA